jgi:hypothetical protein
VHDGVVTALGVGARRAGAIAAPGFVDPQVNDFAGVDPHVHGTVGRTQGRGSFQVTVSEADATRAAVDSCTTGRESLAVAS